MISSFFAYFFFRFHLSTLGFLGKKNVFVILFDFFSIGLPRPDDLEYEFSGLI